MSKVALLEQALFSSATIQQPHALKAYLAAQYIYDELQDDAIWTQTAKLIQQSELQHQYFFDVTQYSIEFSLQRIKNILRRGIYPASYIALWQWYEQEGFANIVEYYLGQAVEQNQYLSHDLTLLLAFSKLYPQLETTQIPVFLQRMTEFITVTYKKEHQAITINAVLQIEDGRLLDACLHQPSFFGHNLITLAWLLRFEADIGALQIQKLKYNLYCQATTQLEDPDDEIDRVLFRQCQAIDQGDFLELLQALLFKHEHNLHQVTLADALLYLAQRYPSKINELKQYMLYQIQLCRKAVKH